MEVGGGGGGGGGRGSTCSYIPQRSTELTSPLSAGR